MNTIARQAMLLAWKDTRIFFRDRAALAFAFLLPFVFVIGFTLALRDVGPENEQLQFTVATQETAGISVQVVETIVAAADGLAAARDYDDALAAVDTGEIDGFVAFPPDFTQRFSGETATLEVMVGRRRSARRRGCPAGVRQEIAVRFSEAQATLSAVVALGSPQDASAAMEELFSDTGGPAIGLRVEQVGRLRLSTPPTSPCRAT